MTRPVFGQPPPRSLKKPVSKPVSVPKPPDLELSVRVKDLIRGYPSQDWERNGNMAQYAFLSLFPNLVDYPPHDYALVFPDRTITIDVKWTPRFTASGHPSKNLLVPERRAGRVCAISDIYPLMMGGPTEDPPEESFVFVGWAYNHEMTDSIPPRTVNVRCCRRIWLLRPPREFLLLYDQMPTPDDL